MMVVTVKAITDVETQQTAPVPWCKPTNERETNEMTKKANEVAEQKPAMGLMAMMAAQEENKQLPAHAQKKSDRGNEDVNTEDLQVPRLKLIQAISDELKKNNPLYNPKAEAGDLLNSVTKQLSKMEEGLYVINLRFVKRWNVWRDRKYKGGGLCGSFETEAEAIQCRNSLAQADGLSLADEEALLQYYEVLETPEHWCLQIDPETCEMSPIIIDMPKTKAKISRQWNTVIKQRMGDRFSTVWKVTSQEAQNGSGDDYHNYNFEPVFYVPDQLYPKVEESYNDVNSMFAKVMPTEELSKAAAEADHDEE